MKKFIVGSLSLAVLIAAFAACGGKPGLPVAGSAKADDMLTLIPKTAEGVFVIDLKRMLNIAFVDESLKTGDDAAKYKEFIEKTGIDPQKDVFLAAIGISQAAGAEGKPAAQAAGVVNLKYDQAKVLAAIKEKSPELQESVYEGVPIFTAPETDGSAPVYGAFLDDSNIAVGVEAGVKSIIDVFKGKAESALKNSTLMDLVKTANKTALAWSVFSFSPEQIKQMTESTPMLQSLDALKALMIYVDDKNKGLQAEIKAISSDAAKNKELADMLTGLKAMGSMGVSEKPEMGELLNKIEISSGADYIKIFVDLPEALMKKLGEEAKKQVESKLEGKKTEEIK